LPTPAPPIDSITPSQDATQTAGITPAPSPFQSTPGAAYGSARIIIRATADSWVQIRDSSRSVILTRVLKAGESYPVPDQPGLSMRTGNAGGLEITVDTAPAPPIGRMGMVRNVALDPKALAEGSAVRE
jgi:cytoskeleton protein RodZ